VDPGCPGLRGLSGSEEPEKRSETIVARFAFWNPDVILCKDSSERKIPEKNNTAGVFIPAVLLS